MLHTELIPAAQRDSRQLLVILHGLGDSKEGFRWLPPTLQLPGLNYLLVNAPDRYYSGFSWYDYFGSPAPGIERSRLLLAGLLDGLPAQGFSHDQTMLLGFSQGCLMTLETGTTYAHHLAGLIGISGYIHNPESKAAALSEVARGQRFLMTHGWQDEVIPLPPVKAQVELLQKAGLQIEWHEFQKAHTIAGHEEISLLRRFILSCLPPCLPPT